MFSCFRCVQLLATLWTVACQAPLSMGFSRQVYWSGLPCPPLRNLPEPEMEPMSPVFRALQAGYLPLCHKGSPYSNSRDPCYCIWIASMIKQCNGIGGDWGSERGEIKEIGRRGGQGGDRKSGLGTRWKKRWVKPDKEIVVKIKTLSTTGSWKF